MASEHLENRLLMAGDFHNALFPPDVNNDQTVSVVDLYGVVSAIREGGPRPLTNAAEGESAPSLFVDVNGDDYLSMGDILDVVYELRGEGEPTGREDNFTVMSNSMGNVLQVLNNDLPAGQVTVTQVGTLQNGIQGVTSPTEFGGTVTVNNPGTVGNTVSYTPGGDFFGRDRFIYEVEDINDNVRRTVVVNVVVEPDPVDPDDKFVQFSFVALDPDTLQPLPNNEVERGETFIVRALVQDIRDDFLPSDQRGVAAAALDLTYNSDAATLVVATPSPPDDPFPREFEFGPNYQSLQNVDAFSEMNGVGLIDEASAGQTGIETVPPFPQPLGPAPQIFFDATFQALPAGTATQITFQGDPADDPANQTLFLRPNLLDAVPTSSIIFLPLTVNVVAPRGAVADMFTRNEDLTPGATPDLSSATLNVLANDTNLNGTTPPVGNIVELRVGNQTSPSQITLPSGSVVSINAGGQSLNYVPAANFFGSEIFTYGVDFNGDGTADDRALVTINVNEINDAPNAVDDSYPAETNVALTIPAPGVLGNDTDADNTDGLPGNNDILIVSRVNGSTANVGVATPTTNGSVVLNADGSFVYTPNQDFTGPDSFTYEVSDSRGGTDTATVNLQVEGERLVDVTLLLRDLNGNPLPVGGDNLPRLNLGQQFQVIVQIQDNRDADQAALGLGIFSAFIDLFYDAQRLDFVGPVTFGPAYNNANFAEVGNSAIDGVIDEVGSPQTNIFGGPIGAGPFTLFSVILQATQFGQATIVTDPADEAGNEIQLFDPPTILTPSDVSFDSAIVNIVNPNPGVPVAVNDTYTVNTGGRLEITTRGQGVLRNDVDPEGDNTIQAVRVVNSGPANGTLVFNIDGTFTYTPNPGFVGTDVFRYQATDGGALSNEATVTLNVVSQPQVVQSVTGVVFTDENANQTRDNNERRLGGVTVILRNNTTGATLTTKTAADGSYGFPNVNAGQYTLTAVQPAFMIDGTNIINGQQRVTSDSIPLNLTGAQQRVDFGELGLRAEFITPMDFFGMGNPNGFQVATNVARPLGQEHWFSLLDGWGNFTKVEASVSANGATVTLRATRNDGQVFTLNNLNIESDPRVRTLGRLGDGIVIRFEGTPADFTPTNPQLAAEGESDYQEAVDHLFAAGWSA